MMSSMDLSQLRYVVTAAEVGNFARAAEALGLNTSTISRRVGRLEDELGVTLFDRGRAGVRLTPSGRAVIVHVKRVLAELEMVKFAGLERDRTAWRNPPGRSNAADRRTRSEPLVNVARASSENFFDHRRTARSRYCNGAARAPSGRGIASKFHALASRGGVAALS